MKKDEQEWGIQRKKPILRSSPEMGKERAKEVFKSRSRSRLRSIADILDVLRDISPTRILIGLLVPSQRVIYTALDDPKPWELISTSAAHYEMIKHFQDIDNRER